MGATKVATHETRKVGNDTITQLGPDELAVEEPLEMRIDNEPVAVTMRTPGDDFDLVAGFLCTEGILKSADEIGAIRYCSDEKQPELRNVINVTPATGIKIDPTKLKRNFYASSSCGICGK